MSKFIQRCTWKLWLNRQWQEIKILGLDINHIFGIPSTWGGVAEGIRLIRIGISQQFTIKKLTKHGRCDRKRLNCSKVLELVEEQGKTWKTKFIFVLKEHLPINEDITLQKYGTPPQSRHLCIIGSPYRGSGVDTTDMWHSAPKSDTCVESQVLMRL